MRELRRLVRSDVVSIGSTVAVAVNIELEEQQKESEHHQAHRPAQR